MKSQKDLKEFERCSHRFPTLSLRLGVVAERVITVSCQIRVKRMSAGFQMQHAGVPVESNRRVGTVGGDIQTRMLRPIVLFTIAPYSGILLVILDLERSARRRSIVYRAVSDA